MVILVNVDSVKAITIVKQEHFVPAQINQQAGEIAVDVEQEVLSFFFILPHQVRAVALAISSMGFRPPAVSKIFSGKNQANVFRRIPDRRELGEGAAMSGPAQAEAQ